MRIVTGVQNVPGPHYLSALVRRALGEEAVAVTAPILPIRDAPFRPTQMHDCFDRDLERIGVQKPVFKSGELVVVVIIQSDGGIDQEQIYFEDMVNFALGCATGKLFSATSQIRARLIYTGVCEAEAQTIVAATPFRDGGE